MPVANGWTRPDWTTWSGDELRSHLEEMQRMGELYFELYESNREGYVQEGDVNPGDLFKSKLSPNLRVWRNVEIAGQTREVAAAEHIKMAQGTMPKFKDIQYVEVNIHPHPGGFTYEATHNYTAPDDTKTTIHVCIVFYVDEDGNVVRTHEYMDSVESNRVREIGATIAS